MPEFVPDPIQDGAPKRQRGDGVPPPKGFDPLRPPRASDDAIRTMVRDAVRRDRLWEVAEWMAARSGSLAWDECWVAVEAMVMAAETPAQGRLISYVAREFLPWDTPRKISTLIREADVWMAWRVKDRRGHEMAKARLAWWRARMEGKMVPGDPPKAHAPPDDAGTVLADYSHLAVQAGLELRWTRPAMAVLLALPAPTLKATLARIVDLYSSEGNRRSCVLVTLRSLRDVLRSVPASTVKPSPPAVGS